LSDKSETLKGRKTLAYIRIGGSVEVAGCYDVRDLTVLAHLQSEAGGYIGHDPHRCYCRYRDTLVHSWNTRAKIRDPTRLIH